MDTGGNSSISDWDRPFTDEELVAIETAFQSATSPLPSFPIKRRRLSSHIDGDRPISRRRLPGSIAGGNRGIGDPGNQSSPLRISNSPLLPCPRNQFFDVHRSWSPAKIETRYPSMTFRGHVVYCRTVSEVEKAAKELLENVEARKRRGDQIILGFDIEWKPTFKRGVPPGKAAVMQICRDISHCYVMHIIHSGIPQKLQCLLEDPTSVKVGVGIVNDACKISKDYNISIKTVEDLSGLANQKFGGELKQWSLASLTERLICKQLPKPGKIRLGNWEVDVLSKEQLKYAATDAFASWYLYQALKSLPDATDGRNDEQGEAAPK
ncbi:DNA helicase [Bertholletia excelsa]